jgi:hypothetical protein
MAVVADILPAGVDKGYEGEDIDFEGEGRDWLGEEGHNFLQEEDTRLGRGEGAGNGRLGEAPEVEDDVLGADIDPVEDTVVALDIVLEEDIDQAGDNAVEEVVHMEAGPGSPVGRMDKTFFFFGSEGLQVVHSE